jgi:hypothetical protein
MGTVYDSRYAHIGKQVTDMHKINRHIRTDLRTMFNG